MPVIPLNLATRSVKTRYGQEGASKLLNCYAEATPDAKHGFAVYAFDGLVSFADTSEVSVRAVHENPDGFAVVVAGTDVFTVSAAGVVSSLGAALSTSGLITMASNQASPAETAIVDADTGIAYLVTSGGIAEISDADLPLVNSVCEIDGYFIFTREDGRAFASAENDGTSIDPLDFANTHSLLKRAVRRGADLVLFGSTKTQFRVNTGAANFPFTLSASRDVGCLSAASVASLDDVVLWVAHDSTVRRLNGYDAVEVGTSEITNLIENDTNKTTIAGFAYVYRGHRWYVLRGTGWCKQMDLSTGDWVDRGSYGLDNWRIVAATSFDGVPLFGDGSSGAVLRPSQTVMTEVGSPIIMEARLGTLHAFPARSALNAVHIDAVRGVGLNATEPQNLDPELMVDWSPDGGATWGAERRVALGRQSQTNQRLIARRFGKIGGEGRTLRLRCSADVVKAVTGVAIGTRPLRP